MMPKFEVVGEEKLKEVDAPSIEDAAKQVKEQVAETKVLEIDESKKQILVKDVVTG